MAPLCKSWAIEVRRASRPLALAQAVLTGAPGSNRLFRSAALARQVDALIGRGGISHIVAFSGQMAQYLPARFGGPVLLDFVDVHSATFRASAEKDRRQPTHWVPKRQARMLAPREAADAHHGQARLLINTADP